MRALRAARALTLLGAWRAAPRQAAALSPAQAAAELARLRALLLRLAAASDALRWADVAGARSAAAGARTRQEANKME